MFFQMVLNQVFDDVCERFSVKCPLSIFSGRDTQSDSFCFSGSGLSALGPWLQWPSAFQIKTAVPLAVTISMLPLCPTVS